MPDTLKALQEREKKTNDDISSLNKKIKVGVIHQSGPVIKLTERALQYLENETAQAQAGLKVRLTAHRITPILKFHLQSQEIFEHQKRQ